jgi:two-component system LytT family sensor kinase
MNSVLPNRGELDSLEQQLANQKDEKQQLVLLDRLIGHFAFSNVHRAKELLSEQKVLLKKYDLPDFWMDYYLHAAFVENQLYHYDQSEEYYLQAIELIDERGDVKQQASAYIDYAGTCINLNHLDQATHYLEKASKLLKIFPDQRLMSRLICREGYLNLHYSNYTKAIEFFLEADKKIQSLQPPLDYTDYYFQTLINSGLGKVYERNNEWEKSVRAYLKVANMCEALEMRTRLSWHYLNVGIGFMALNDDKGAELYFLKAIDTTDDSSQLARASAYANLGFIYFQRKRYEKALDLYDRAEQGYRENKAADFYNFSNINRWKAHLYLELGDHNEAMEHFIAALNYAKKVEDYKQISGIYRDIASFHAELGDYKSAYEYQMLCDQFAEKYNEEVNLQKILELEVKYEAEQKKKEAELLRLQATKLQLKALRAQMNPHFMYNALNAIQHYITSNETKNAAKYLAKFAKLMRQSLEYSELEIISLEKEIEFLDDYLTINGKLRFEGRLKYEIEVDDEIEEDILGVPTMIVQPYVENAIEHGLRTRQNGQIHVSFSPIDDFTILCVVEDNGIGRAAAKRIQEKDPEIADHKSRGTSITEKRLDILHHSKDKGVMIRTIDLLDQQTGEGKGTRVEIKIPIVEIQIK